MTTQETTETTEVVEAEAPKDDGKGLRKQLNASLDREKKYKTQLLDNAYEELKLDPNTGLGKAIAKEYEGEPTLDALAAYAKDEYEYEAPAAESADHPQAELIAQQQAALDAVGGTAGSVVDPTQGDVLAQAEADGDYQKTMAIKAQEVNSWFGSGPNRN
jgi:hypothetical protein